MNSEQEQIYQEGYQAFLRGEAEEANPFSGLKAEFWLDGYDDAAEDERE